MLSEYYPVPALVPERAKEKHWKWVQVLEKGQSVITARSSITGDSTMTNHRNSARVDANALGMNMPSTWHNERGKLSGAMQSDYFHSWIAVKKHI